jgi:hypothetical protein
LGYFLKAQTYFLGGNSSSIMVIFWATFYFLHFSLNKQFGSLIVVPILSFLKCFEVSVLGYLI